MQQRTSRRDLGSQVASGLSGRHEVKKPSGSASWHDKPALRDLVWAGLAIGPLLAGLISLDFVEWFFQATREYEHRNLDEWLAAAPLLAFGAAWYSFRRWRESLRLSEGLAESNKGLSDLNQVLTATQDEAQRAENDMRESETQLQTLIDALPILISYIDAEQRYRRVNRAYEEWFGHPSSSIPGRHISEVAGEAAYQNLLDKIERALAGEAITFEATMPYPTGAARQVRASYVPDFGETGEVKGFFVAVTDLTEHHQMEAQLRRSQRLEAVGQLTGGVAHDFNNLLASISLDAGLLEGRLAQDGKGQVLAEHIKGTVKRGRSLTARLLAFARQQSLLPRASDISGLIESLEDLLERTLGETVVLKYERTPDLWPAMIDPHQFESALVNLAINARDAMPDGGPLEIATRNAVLDEAYAARHGDVSAGDYIEISVRDAGTGMPPEVLAKAFEPFFTTKEVDQGSGLGLSMVYGFVKQSNGDITIESRLGQGTAVTLYLPRSQEAAASVGERKLALDLLQRSPRILVLDDDPDDREYSASVLREGGYEVFEAKSGREAIRRLKDGETFDLLLTDVVLPGGQNGGEIAVPAERLQPGLKVLYTSGFADESLRRREETDQGVGLLKKSWNEGKLLDMVREVLDCEAPSQASPIRGERDHAV